MSPACSSSSRRSAAALGHQLPESSPSPASSSSSSTPHRPSASLAASARCARRGRRCRPRRHDGLRRRGSGCRQPRSRPPRCPAPSGDRCRRRRRRAPRQQRLAFPGVPGAAPPGGGLEVRLGAGSCPMGRHPRHVCSRVGGRGRHRALRCHGVAVRARRRVRAVPDLRQRSPGTTNCAPTPSITVARPCTPTRRTIRGCSSDSAEEKPTAAGRPCHRCPDQRDRRHSR